MKILLVGGSGFLGRGLVESYRRLEDVEPVIWDLPDTIEDIRQKDLDSIDAVVNLAVFPETEEVRGIHSSSKSWTITVLGVSHLLGLCEASGIPLVQISTREAHGYTLEKSEVVFENGLLRPRVLVDEAVSPNPTSPYGKSKLIAEWLCSASPAGYSIRLGTPYTDELPETGGGLITSLVRKSLRECSVKLARGGIQFRDPLHVEDIATLIKAVVEVRPNQSLFHAGHGGKNLISLREIVKLSNPEAKIIPTPGGDYGFAADISRAKKLLGWEPTVAVRTKIAEYSRYFQGLG